jgi:hypothetical protein
MSDLRNRLMAVVHEYDNRPETTEHLTMISMLLEEAAIALMDAEIHIDHLERTRANTEMILAEYRRKENECAPCP